MKAAQKYISHVMSRVYQTLALYVLLLLTSAAVHSQATTQALSEARRFAMLVPETSSKARVIYNEIESGLASRDNVELLRYNFTANSTEQDVQNWLQDQGIDAVITIGKSAYKIAKSASSLPIVAGGMSIIPEGHAGVSLVGNPGEFFTNAKKHAPQLERVHLVYNEKINGWWVKEALAEAAKHELELVTLEVNDVKTGAKGYNKLLKEARAGKDAIWIPLISVVPSKTVLPMVLKKAWSKRLVVFTNSASHAKQGALFSLYPDNFAMGEQLIDLAIEQLDSPEAEAKPVTIKQLKKAFNWRTASHLGLDYSLDEGSGFDRIYPVQ